MKSCETLALQHLQQLTPESLARSAIESYRICSIKRHGP